MSQNKIPNSLTFDYDLVIIGGGIVGATLAAALQDSGLKIAIVEAQPLGAAAARKRAYALSLLSGSIFDGIGVWQQMLPQISKFSQIKLSDADYPFIVGFDKTELGTEFLGYVGQHGDILTCLQEFLAKCSHIDWLCPAEVLKVDYSQSQANIEVQLGEQKQTITSKLIVGADGARSQIRQWANIKTHGWKYWQSCITFTIKHEAPRNDIAFERFWYTGPMGVLPLAENRCQIVWTLPNPQAQQMQQAAPEEFIKKLEVYLGGVFGNWELESDRFVFPVQLMQCDRYIQPRLALVGDAAHCCHPVGGQGLNLGIRDAAALAQILKEAAAQGKDIGDVSVLKRYQSWRKKENWVILAFTDFLNRFFSNNIPPIVIIRRFGLWIMQNLPLLKLWALQLMTGLKGRKPKIVLHNS